MKVALFAAALTLVVGTQANASWAENANKEYPVFAGTDQALVRRKLSGTTGIQFGTRIMRRANSIAGKPLSASSFAEEPVVAFAFIRNRTQLRPGPYGPPTVGASTLHGRKCIAVAANSAAKIKKATSLAIAETTRSPMPYPPDAAPMARATPTMRNNAANIA